MIFKTFFELCGIADFAIAAHLSNCYKTIESVLFEKVELIRNQAVAAAKMKVEQEEMEILLASKKSQLDVKTTYKASILSCFQT